MSGEIANVGAMANKGADVFVKYAPPLLGLATGYVIGDLLGATGYIHGAIVGAGTATANAETERVAKFLTAGIYTAIAIFLWKGLDHMIGLFLAGMFAGMALRILISALGV